MFLSGQTQRTGLFIYPSNEIQDISDGNYS
jgi:hypothetical protein